MPFAFIPPCVRQVVHGLTISAPGRTLLSSANLQLLKGRERLGLGGLLIGVAAVEVLGLVRGNLKGRLDGRNIRSQAPINIQQAYARSGVHHTARGGVM